MIAGAFTLLGAAIGGGMPYLIRVFEFRREVSSIKAAFRAEISAILKGTDVRKHEDNYLQILAAWKNGDDYRYAVWGSDTIKVDPVFAANVDKIGLLGENISRDLVLF